MSTKTDTKPSDTSATKDNRKRHIVKRLTPLGFLPPEYSDTALCGEKVQELLKNHNGEICQECVDEQRRRGAK